MQGQHLQELGVEAYAGRLKEHKDQFPCQSDFSFGLYGQRWIDAMELWTDWALRLIALKPHKRLYFQRGFQALSLMQQAIYPPCHPLSHSTGSPVQSLAES